MKNTITSQKNDVKNIKVNCGEKMRYIKLNDFYLLDTYTKMKIDQSKALELLNTYEEALKNEPGEPNTQSIKA